MDTQNILHPSLDAGIGRGDGGTLAVSQWFRAQTHSMRPRLCSVPVGVEEPTAKRAGRNLTPSDFVRQNLSNLQKGGGNDVAVQFRLLGSPGGHRIP